MSAIKSFECAVLEVECACQNGFSPISMHNTAASRLDSSVIAIVLLFNLVMALIKADQVTVLNGLSAVFVKGCRGKFGGLSEGVIP